MRSKTHPDFPRYTFFEDGTIVNNQTNHPKKVSRSMKLLNANGLRKTVNSQKLFSELFPDLYSYHVKQTKPSYKPIQKPKRRKYDPRLLRRIKRCFEKEGLTKTMEKFNIPLGSVGYITDLIKVKAHTGKGNTDIRPIIKVYIKKVIIKAQ